MRSIVANYARVVDVDQMNQSPRDLCKSISAIKSITSRNVMLLANRKRNLVPHGEKETKIMGV